MAHLPHALACRGHRQAHHKCLTQITMTKIYYDDCPFCVADRKADDEGRETTKEEVIAATREYREKRLKEFNEKKNV